MRVCKAPVLSRPLEIIPKVVSLGIFCYSQGQSNMTEEGKFHRQGASIRGTEGKQLVVTENGEPVAVILTVNEFEEMRHRLGEVAAAEAEHEGEPRGPQAMEQTENSPPQPALDALCHFCELMM